MGDYILLFISCIFVNNILLMQYLGNCPFLGTSKRMETAVGMGIGYTLALSALSAIREILGNGTFYKMAVFGPGFEPFRFMVEAPGAFMCLGLMLCVMNVIGKK